MDIKKQLNVLGFCPKENAVDVFEKKYPQADGYYIEVNVGEQRIDYGNKIKAESKTTQNFFQIENFVVLECVNRLLEKGYKPQNITLEKTFPLGHNSGRLDILVTRDDETAYLMIECKTIEKEFDKALRKLKSDGGQLFTYFQQDKSAEILMLYASDIKENHVDYKNEIIHIEDDYRQTNNVKDFFDRWNKLPISNGVFEEWVKPYRFQSKALTPNDLKSITQEDSGIIFNSFLEILRHNVVSDKPNAFNKIFTLFLCKIYDEKTTKPNEELKFQWLEGKDDDVSFQIRLTNLYKEGMFEFLEKEVTDFSEEDFDTEYNDLPKRHKESLLRKINKLRLEKNNEFAIKEVFDEKTFKENAKIVKEVVELLQRFRLRYNKRQQYLSDFFELLLTTGLKQEAGQFFTPVPIAQFIIKSLPIDKFVDEKLDKGTNNDLLPYIIDYAAGSGHFITESMHEIQRLIDEKKADNYVESSAKKIKTWQNDHFDWATQYVYGVEKDYRLVKVGKVGCYLHGDGLANVILSDGLARFDHSEYKGKLHYADKDFSKENKQFDILISNPPYSVSAFKNTAKEYYTKENFELYDSLTDSSSEIECLFIERTKQLLKDGGVAGIILPSSILSNDGIYTKAREIVLQNFEIIAITELGSNTFMATGTNTVVLFLRRRNNYDSINLQKSINKFFSDYQDVTLNGVEKPFSKYVDHVWETITLEDYVSLLKNAPNASVENHDFYKSFRKSVESAINSEIFKQKKNRKTMLTETDMQKIKERVERDCFNCMIKTEKEKLLYFVLAYPQRVVLVKTGEKEAEKRFLGYEFSSRRGREGIHPIQRGKTIDECTKLFDDDCFDNEEKVSTYIYKAFYDDYETQIHESLKDNISRVRLVDMLSFDSVEFTKDISTAVKKKVKIESKYEQVLFTDAIKNINGSTEKIEKFNIKEAGKYPVITQEKENLINGYSDSENPVSDLPILLFGDHSCTLKYLDFKFFRGADGTVLLKPRDSFIPKYFYNVLQYCLLNLVVNKEKYERHYKYLQNLYIPLPSKEIQQKIVAEIEMLEKKEAEADEKIKHLKKDIEKIMDSIKGERKELRELCRYSDTRIDNALLTPKNYIGVDNLLQNTMGKVDSDFVPNSGTSTEYNIRDILLSNIRPYLKKIWYADNYGGSSNDVLVLQKTSEKVDSAYIYYHLKQDSFFDYEMQKTKGMKMPRGNKQHILDFEIPILPLSEQRKIVTKIEKMEVQINQEQKIIANMPTLKKDVLKKYGIS